MIKRRLALGACTPPQPPSQTPPPHCPSRTHPPSPIAQTRRVPPLPPCVAECYVTLLWINGENGALFQQPDLKCAKSVQATPIFE